MNKFWPEFRRWEQINFKELDRVDPTFWPVTSGSVTVQEDKSMHPRVIGCPLEPIFPNRRIESILAHNARFESNPDMRPSLIKPASGTTTYPLIVDGSFVPDPCIPAPFSCPSSTTTATTYTTPPLSTTVSARSSSRLTDRCHLQIHGQLPPSRHHERSPHPVIVFHLHRGRQLKVDHLSPPPDPQLIVSFSSPQYKFGEREDRHDAGLGSITSPSSHRMHQK
uniref:Uncharacterized protein n=1 Tax=Oryza glumipatula TaxID=40148 RepID=A0A0D9ZVY6_9ORYZ